MTNQSFDKQNTVRIDRWDMSAIGAWPSNRLKSNASFFYSDPTIAIRSVRELTSSDRSLQFYLLWWNSIHPLITCHWNRSWPRRVICLFKKNSTHQIPNGKRRCLLVFGLAGFVADGAVVDGRLFLLEWFWRGAEGYAWYDALPTLLAPECGV